MNVVFVNENTLGHSSYLLPFVKQLREHPELGVTPHLIHATPLPDHLAKRANFSIRGLRKWGLDFHNARWRMTVSRFVRDQLQPMTASGDVDAVVVNTQSVALALEEIAADVPIFLALDATFHQLSNSRWFAPNFGSRIFLPLTAATLRMRERNIMKAARGLFPWSEEVRESLICDYGCSPGRICLLPPSIDRRHSNRGERAPNVRPRILFMGGDFRRKGGPLLLECYRRWFCGSCDLHLVTESPIEREPGVYVHNGIKPFTAAWYDLWNMADVFVFPSTLDTFGIVLLEALAFEVPVIAAEVGAARFVLGGGEAGWLLRDRTPECLADALRSTLRDREATNECILNGRDRVREFFDLSTNAAKLAEVLRASVSLGAFDRVTQIATHPS